MRTLEKLTIKNFKSIREQTLELGRLNVFIGGNGAGKSNLIEVFRFLREIVNQNLAGYVGVKGGADTLLHYGKKKSSEISFILEFGENDTITTYSVVLHGTEDDNFLLAGETVSWRQKNHPLISSVGLLISSFTKQSTLRTDERGFAREAAHNLENCRVYHFHDTSDTAVVKGTADVEDNRFLRPKAENLAAFLYWMQQKQPDHFTNIQDTVRQIAPFFEEFRLAPSKLNENKIKLEWKEKGSDAYFNASSLSDGTLRFICLTTLLMQPELPPLVLLDEPELGLHPAAVNLLAGMLSSAASRTQIIVATQSVTLLNQLDPESVWTVDREDNQSVFRHLSEHDMSAWLDDYGLGDLWEKNVLGARP